MIIKGGCKGKRAKERGTKKKGMNDMNDMFVHWTITVAGIEVTRFRTKQHKQQKKSVNKRRNDNNQNYNENLHNNSKTTATPTETTTTTTTTITREQTKTSTSTIRWDNDLTWFAVSELGHCNSVNCFWNYYDNKQEYHDQLSPERRSNIGASWLIAGIRCRTSII